MQWVTLPTKTGAPVVKQRLEPMPAGPYLVCSQFDENLFEGIHYMDARKQYPEKLHHGLPAYGLGSVAFSFDNELMVARKCWVHYDTSD